MKKRLEFLDWEFGVFFHFGIRTFYEDRVDWDGEEMPAEKFNPTQLDCEQWIRTAEDAGAKYAVLVCKHHDGFANWNTKYSNYSVAATPWKGGKGDVVEDFVNACRKYGMKVGLYYSPADFESKNRSNTEHDDFFINQISELLGNYGEIDYLWFDACGSENHKYDEERIMKAVRKLQPNILVFNMWDPDTRWIGNEQGIAPSPNFNNVTSLDFSMLDANPSILKEKMFLPAECDCRMRRYRWFYSEKEDTDIKSLNQLMGLYYYSVGRGANLLLNIGPDRRGLLPDNEAERLLEFGAEIKRRFSNPIPYKMENKYLCKMDEYTPVNHVVLKEDLSNGEHVEKFKVMVYPDSVHKPIKVFEGDTIGHKRICSFPMFCTDRVEVIIERASGEVSLEIELFNVE